MKVFLAIALLVPALAWAGDQSLDVTKVVAQQKQIRSELMASKDYRGLTEAERAELLSRQDALLRTLEGKSSADELDDKQRMLAFNDLEWIEGVLNDEQDERLICKQEKKLGSNRPVRICRTAAQIEQERELARKQMGGARICNFGCG